MNITAQGVHSWASLGAIRVQQNQLAKKQNILQGILE